MPAFWGSGRLRPWETGRGWLLLRQIKARCSFRRPTPATTARPVPSKPRVPGSGTTLLPPAATASDDVVIERHRAIHRQGAAAADARAGSQGNASIRENI